MTGPPGDAPAARYVGIGIGAYKETVFPPLPGAPAEVREIAELLGALGVHATVAAATTETAIMDELDQVLPAQPEPSGGQLVVLWAGHGDRLPDAPVRLVAQDTIKNRAARLTPEYVASVAVRSGATQVLLIFDTCFSGGGALPVLAGADRWFGEHEGPPGRVWLGVLASAMDWQKARDDLFGDRLALLLRDGPSQAESRLRGWSPQNEKIRGDDLIDALQKEWPDSSPHRPKTAQFGNPWALLPNPQHDPAAPPRVVEHLLHAARGGEPEDETWYFTGRHAVIARLVAWMGSGQPGMHVVTGPAGCGKSAVLGLVVCLSHPEQRAALLARGPLGYPDPGEGSVHAHVYARGLARGQLVRELDVQLSDAGVLPADRRGLRGAGELADAAAASGSCPVVVVDGLDEAGVEAWPVAEEVLRLLARHALVLVGTRELAAPGGGDSLVTRLQPDAAQVVHLLAEVDDPGDVRDYVVRRLRDVPAPAMDSGEVAGAILALPGGQEEEEGRFLLARIITAQLRAGPVHTDQPGWQQQLSTSVETALDRDLDGLPARVRGEGRLTAAGLDLLVGLAWAQGAGLPDDIWPLVATAVSADGTSYARDDAFWALANAGRYIVEAGEAGHAVYRLSHQRLAQHLRSRTRDRGVQDAELRIATALVNAYEGMLTAGVTPAGHAYLWQYTWRHCADAGTSGITALRRLVSLDRAAFLPELALASRYLANRQVEAGKPFEAVGPAEDTVTICRELAVVNAGYLPDLAAALTSLGGRYGEVGRRADAVAPTEEAVTLYRDQAANPAYLPDLAAALTNLGGRYGEVGRRADAVAPTEEAVTLYRDQAAANPAYLPNLAAALTSLVGRYSEVGRRADAVAPAEEAVTLYRDQAAANPAYLPNLAAALTSLGISYSQVGRRADAVLPTEEAVTLYRDQAAANPAHQPDLAMALNNLGGRYSQVGRRADAVAAAEEAVTLRRDQAAANPAYLPDLAGALTSLGVFYGEVGRRADAVAPAEEAVTLRRDQAAANPAYLPNLAGALTNLGIRYGEVGRRADAVAPTEEAVTLYRDQAAANPAYLPNLAAALTSLVGRYSQVGRRADAVAPAEEAVTLYRDQAAANPAYLPNLAMALTNLGISYSQVGRRADAVAPTEEAVTLYRDQAAANPAHQPDLAMALTNLGGRYSQVGRRADAVAPAEEAVTLYRDQAANPAYLPNLAMALTNLGGRYSQVGRRADAVAPAEEAVTLYRDQAANPAYLPNLAMALTSLGVRYSEVGRRADAVAPAEEAVTLYRDQAAANPTYQPDLAMALTNLGSHYSQVGRRADAVAPTEEAVTLRREQAATNPAYLPNLATALSNLGQYQQDAGSSWNADKAWSAAVDAMPTPDLKAGLLLEKARRATPPQAIGDLLAALSLTPPPTGSALFTLHARCRKLRASDQDLFDRLWEERLKTGHPPWLGLDDVTLTATTEWLDTPTHALARGYHRDHTDILARPSAWTALDELAVAGIDPDLISQHRQLLTTAAEQGIEEAYRPLIVAESLSTWLDADIPRQQQLLQEDRETLLSSDAAELLGQWSADDPDDIRVRFGAALLSLARDGLEPEVFAALDDDDPGQLNLLLSNLLAGARPRQLRAAAELALCLDLDEQALAHARLHLAIALAITGRAGDAPGHARAAARLDPGSVNRWVGLLAQLVPAHPELAALIQALVTTTTDQPDGTSSRDRPADP